MDLNRVRRQSFSAESSRHFRRQHRAHSAVHVANGKMNFDRLAMIEGVLCKLYDLIIERLVESVILQLDAMQRLVRADIGTTQNIREIDVACFPMPDCFVRVETLEDRK